MPPKSSASSATRKKHTRKAAGPVVETEAPPPREKGKKHRPDRPRQKAYIAPVKTSAALADPLETTGLAHRPPPELFVVLRSLGKKAPVTKVRALEELQSGWVDRCGEDGDESVVYALLDMVLVWLHNLPAHLLHPDRRIRLLTASVHAALRRIPLLAAPLSDGASTTAASAWAPATYAFDAWIFGLRCFVEVSFCPSPCLPSLPSRPPRTRSTTRAAYMHTTKTDAAHRPQCAARTPHVRALRRIISIVCISDAPRADSWTSYRTSKSRRTLRTLVPPDVVRTLEVDPGDAPRGLLPVFFASVLTIPVPVTIFEQALHTQPTSSHPLRHRQRGCARRVDGVPPTAFENRGAARGA
ncbi:hypothetical protein FB451DRAFT_1231984 [Mycena latifolia]|nr:hypothetical protein FB451DRAFT_1231984 [Mycena latifolia]